MRPYRGFLLALLVTALLTPVGLYLPEILKAGAAWGEWGVDEVRRMVGYAPEGMERAAKTWKAPVPGYAPPAGGESSLPKRSVRYVLSAFLGAAACGAGAWLLARRLTRRRGDPGTGRGAGAS